MGTSSSRCCAAKEAQMAEVKSEAVGMENHSLFQEDAAPKDGAEAVLDNSMEAKAPPESQQEEIKNLEPEKEPLTNSATEEQAEEAPEKELSEVTTPVSEFSPQPDAQEQMPVLLGTEGEQTDKKAVEKTDGSEKALEETKSQPAEESSKKKEADKNTKAGSKDKKKVGDKEHSKTKSKQTPDSKTGKKSEGGKSEGSSTKKGGADDFKVLEGKDAFVGKDADAMKAVDIEECKQKCRAREYGAFIVWEGVACFRTQSGEDCLKNLVDAPTATLYVYVPDGDKKEESQAPPTTQEEAKGDAPVKEASKATVGKPRSDAKPESRKKSTPKTEAPKTALSCEAADSSTTIAAAEAAKVDDAAKKRERKEAWKAMSDAEKKEKGSALLAAAKAGKAAEVKKMLEENVSQDYVDGDGWSGLHFAANEGKLDVAVLLLQYDADPTLTIKLGEWGQTPLHYAARQGNREIAEKLVAADKKGKALRTKHWKGKVPHEMASGDLAKYLKKMAKQGS